MDEKFPKKTSIDESKGEMLMDCNHMDQATNMGGDIYVLKSTKRILQKSEYIVIINLEKGVTN